MRFIHSCYLIELFMGIKYKQLGILGTEMREKKYHEVSKKQYEYLFELPPMLNNRSSTNYSR